MKPLFGIDPIKYNQWKIVTLDNKTTAQLITYFITGVWVKKLPPS